MNILFLYKESVRIGTPITIMCAQLILQFLGGTVTYLVDTQRFDLWNDLLPVLYIDLTHLLGKFLKSIPLLTLLQLNQYTGYYGEMNTKFNSRLISRLQSRLNSWLNSGCNPGFISVEVSLSDCFIRLVYIILLLWEYILHIIMIAWSIKNSEGKFLY